MISTMIERLSSATKSKLRSTQILSSLPQLVSEILQNSLDANARHIDIGIDCEGWTFWIKDDGFGINREGLEIIGRGEDHGRYNTSKEYTTSTNATSTFGFRGEALASAAEISCLEICTRTVYSRDTWSVIVKGGNALYNGPAVRWRRETPGTVVCIRDAFYNLPVRRLSHPSPARTWDSIRQEVETYALVFPEVAFTLENTHDRDSGKDKERFLRIPKTSSTLFSFSHIFGRALVEHVEEIDYAFGSIYVQGFISLNGAQSKAFQFLYINRHPISNCDFHRKIEAKFASSSFSKNALDEGGESGLPRSNVRRSPRKAERKPVFVLNIKIPPDEVDNSLEPSKNNVHLQNTTSVFACLDEVVSAFLVKHGFSVKKSQSERISDNDDMPSPRKRRRMSAGDDSGYAEISPFLDSSESLANESIAPQERIFGPIVRNGETSDIVWTDPTSSRQFSINSRTGHSSLLPSDPQNSNHFERRTVLQNKINVKPDIPHWLQQALESNSTYPLSEEKIPSVSHLIPSISNTSATHDCRRGVHAARIHSSGPETCLSTFTKEITKEQLSRAKVISQIDQKFIACLIGPQPPTTSEAREPSNPKKENDPEGTLILVDQHAADERVRVERFLKELCLRFLRSSSSGKDPMTPVEIKTLIPPRPVLLSWHEALMIKEEKGIQEILQNWGFEFTSFPDFGLDNAHSGVSSEDVRYGTYVQLLIQSIPEVVSDKLLQGNELQELIKGYIGQIQTDPNLLDHIRHSDTDWEDEFYWIKALRWCPRRLLDLVNSRACRGAIMFNDPLTIEQCERLIKQLSQTAFPFQCAHGRPSLLPLTNVDVGFRGAQHRNCQWSRLETKGAEKGNRI